MDRLKSGMVVKLLAICLIGLGLTASTLLNAQPARNKEQHGLAGFTLSGTIENAGHPYIYLIYEDWQGSRMKDSCRIVDGKFQFRGRLNEPVLAILRGNPKTLPDNTNPNITQIFLEEGELTVHVVHNDFKSVRVSGSKTHTDKVRFESLITPYIDQYAAIQSHLLKAKEESFPKFQRDSLVRLSEASVRGMRSTSYHFIAENSDSHFSVHELNSMKNQWPLDTVKGLFNNLDPEIRKSANGRKIEEMIRSKESAAVGAMAYDFSGLDIDGRAIRLSDFRGSYVLVDFWGSWCAPCREGNPHLIELYKRYRDRGFEIIGIACQDKDLLWRKAVAKDGIGIWRNILERDERGLAIANRYAVNSFPTKILVDREGRILGRFGGNDTDKLDRILAETFKK
ncbi:MAG: AhpC/TSA family protein [Bacteroidetes bacterium]|nr:AhpC/TSA family protein [Bacteroidota bacterium]